MNFNSLIGIIVGLVGVFTLFATVANSAEEEEISSLPSDLSLIQDEKVYPVPERFLGDIADLPSAPAAYRDKRSIKLLIIKGLILKKLLILSSLKKKIPRPSQAPYGPPQPVYGVQPTSSYGQPYGRR